MTNINLIKNLNASITCSGISESDLAKVLNGNIYSNYATISSATTIDIDLGKSCFFDKVSLRCLSSTAPTGLTFSVSNNGVSYTTVSSMSSSYKMTTYSASPTWASTTGGQCFSAYDGKMYMIRYSASQQTSSNNKVHIYNPSNNSWSNFSTLPISIGGACALVTHPTSNLAYFEAGNNSSNFYQVNLSTQVITPKTPMPYASYAISDNGATNVFTYDTVRDRIYFYQYGANAAKDCFVVYDVNKNSWTTLTLPSTGYSWVVYHEKLDKVIIGSISSGNVYQYDPFKNSLSFLETLTNPNGNFNQMRHATAVYSRKHELIFIPTTTCQTANQPIMISAYDPTHTKFSGWKTVIYDTGFSPNPNFLADSQVLSYDAANDTFYTGHQNISNAKFSFKDVDLFSHYGNVSGGPYRYVRVSLSAGTIAELGVYANSSSISMLDSSSYTLNNYGKTGDQASYSFVNNVGTATDIVLSIEPDGSEGSRCTEISIDGSNWVSHCVSNDLASSLCLARNLNYRTSNCGFGCTIENGGGAAEDGFSPGNVNYGPTASGITSVFKTRTVTPEGYTNIDRTFKIGVEIQV